MFHVKRIYAVLFVILTVLSVYYSSIFAEVLYIDDQQMIDNLLNRDDFTFKGLFLRGSGYYYRPVNYLTYVADKYLWGLHESFMHLENIILHAFNACLVYFIAVRVAVFQGEDSRTPPLFAALLFALHPIATESVNWISGRTDLLAGFFLLSSLLLLLHGLKSGKSSTVILAAFAFLVAPFAKETALFWLPAALLLVYSFSRNSEHQFPDDLYATLRSHAIHYGALCAVPVAYFVLRHLALIRHDSGIGLAVNGIIKGDDLDLFNKVRITLKVFGFYLKKLVAPLPLNFFINSFSNWYVIVGILGILFCLYLCWRRSLISSLLLMSVCIISPALLVPLAKMALAPVAERYLYMPSAFFAVTVAVGGASLVNRYRLSNFAVTAAAIFILFAAGFATWQRNLVWQTNLAFFQEAVRQNPDNMPMRNDLAKALGNAGKNDEAQRLYLANKMPETEKYHVALEINRARTLVAKKDIKGAVSLLKRVDCPESNPFYITYLQNRMYLNDLLLEQNTDPKLRNTIRLENIELMKKMQLRTGDPYCYYRIGQLCLFAGDKKRAAEYFRLAAEKSPAKSVYKEPARKLAERLSR